jgi:hypothetical protein
MSGRSLPGAAPVGVLLLAWVSVACAGSQSDSRAAVTTTAAPTQVAAASPARSPAPSPPAAKASPAARPASPSPSPTAPPRRLANGHFLREHPRQGLGKLTIENGQQADAVAVLTTPEKVTVLSVYVRGGDSFTVEQIADGTYRLFFMIGEDWDDAANRFTRRPGLSAFDDDFAFTTTRTAEGVRFSTFRITLQPVAGGTAETDPVNPQDFPAIE